MGRAFLADSMLGKFCRWLRILGVDAAYRGAASDEELVRAARREGRILLTRDEALFRLAEGRGVQAFLVEGNSEADRLANFARRFNLELNIDTRRSLCPLCNSPLRPVRKESVRGEVPPASFRAYRRFWACAGCGKVYWMGSHWGRMRGLLKQARALVEAQAKG